MTCIEWHPTNNNSLFLGTGSGSLMEYSYGAPQPRNVGCDQNSVTALQFDPLKRYVAVGDASGTITTYDFKSMIVTAAVETGMYSVDRLSLSAAGDLVGCLSDDGQVNVFYVGWEEPLVPESVKLVRSDEQCRDMAWHPRVHLLALALSVRERYDRDSGFVRIVGNTQPTMELKMDKK